MAQSGGGNGAGWQPLAGPWVGDFELHTMPDGSRVAVGGLLCLTVDAHKAEHVKLCHRRALQPHAGRKRSALLAELDDVKLFVLPDNRLVLTKRDLM